MGTNDAHKQKTVAQTSLEDLAAAGLLSEVFEHAERPHDFFTFSMVCTTWREESASVCPKKLVLEPEHFKQPFATGLGRWLADLQQQKRLWQMTELHLTAIKAQLLPEDSAEDAQGVLQDLSTRLFTVLGLMPLQACHISGPFDVAAVRLLPASLVNLHFSGDFESMSSVNSSLWGMSKNLQTLSLHANDGHSKFCIDSVMPCLRQLRIPNVGLTVAPGCDVAGCLPLIVSVVAEVHVQPGCAAFLQDLLQVVTTLGVRLEYLYGPLPLNLSMQKSSPLQSLRLIAVPDSRQPNSDVVANVQLSKVVNGSFAGNVNVCYRD